MLSVQEIEQGLSQCYGSQNMYKYTLGGFVYTEGVQFVAQSCDAYWLIDAIASYQGKFSVKSEQFQV